MDSWQSFSLAGGHSDLSLFEHSLAEFQLGWMTISSELVYGYLGRVPAWLVDNHL
jgi:hypothetical protein